MSTSFIGLKRWMNLMLAILFLVAAYGTAVSVEIGGLPSAVSEPASKPPVSGDLIGQADSRTRTPLPLTQQAEQARIKPQAEPAIPVTNAKADSTVPADRVRKAEPKPAPPKRYPKVKVLATGYTAGVESTGKRPGHPAYGITYSGVKVRRDLVSTVAADPKVFPIGTLLYIPGYGYGVVADTGSAIKGHKIDLYFESKREVFRHWGKRKVEVEVLRRGQGKLKESWLRAINSAVSVEKKIPDAFMEM